MWHSTTIIRSTTIVLVTAAHSTAHSFSMHLSLNIIFAIILAVIFVLVWGGLYTFFCVMMRRPHQENPEQFELPNLVI